MFGNMLGKLQEAQQKMEEIKERLDSVSVKGTSGNGKVEIIVSASKKIREVNLTDEVMQIEDKEELEDLLVLALEDAMTKAENVAESESKGAMNGVLPNIPGLNL